MDDIDDIDDLDALWSAAIAGNVHAMAWLEMEAEKGRTTILHTAAGKGNTEHVRFIVRNIANKQNLWVKLDWEQSTALHHAVLHQRCDVLEVLIDGARQFFQDNNVSSSFSANDDEPHKSAVTSFQAYIRQVNKDSYTALSYGVLRGCLRCVKMLVVADPTDRHTKFHDRDMWFQDGSLISPMYAAAVLGNMDVVKMICKTCTAPSLDGPGGSTALHAAIKHLNQAKEKDTDVIRVIIDAAKRSCTPPYGSFKDLFNQTDESEHTVLELAVIGNQVNVVALILKEDPAYQHSGPSKKHGLMRLIYKAIDDKNTDIVELLSKT